MTGAVPKIFVEGAGAPNENGVDVVLAAGAPKLKVEVVGPGEEIGVVGLEPKLKEFVAGCPNPAKEGVATGVGAGGPNVNGEATTGEGAVDPNPLKEFVGGKVEVVAVGAPKLNVGLRPLGRGGELSSMPLSPSFSSSIGGGTTALPNPPNPFVGVAPKMGVTGPIGALEGAPKVKGAGFASAFKGVGGAPKVKGDGVVVGAGAKKEFEPNAVVDSLLDCKNHQYSAMKLKDSITHINLAKDIVRFYWSTDACRTASEE